MTDAHLCVQRQSQQLEIAKHAYFKHDLEMSEIEAGQSNVTAFSERMTDLIHLLDDPDTCQLDTTRQRVMNLSRKFQRVSVP